MTESGKKRNIVFVVNQRERINTFQVLPWIWFLPSSSCGPFGARARVYGRVIFAVAMRQWCELEVGHQFWREDRLQVLGKSKMIGFGNIDTSRFQVESFVVPVWIDRRKCVRVLVVSTKQQSGQSRDAWV